MMSVRRLAATLVALWICAALLFALANPLAVQAQQGGPGDGGKIDAGLLQTLAAQGRSNYVLVMGEQADLSAAYGMTDWSARGRYVVDALRATAQKSQAPVIATLESQGLRYRSFIAANQIYVYAGTLNSAQSLAVLPGVSEVRAPVEASLDNSDLVTWQGNPDMDSTAQAVHDWGIDASKAPDFWSAYGASGHGIRVANIDTGVQYDHPALAGAYQCANGDPSDPSCWYDPTGVCVDGLPCDNHGHGTHTMGTMVGSNAATLDYNVGMAPSATWIACKGCVNNNCADEDLLACADWILEPGGNPDNRPDVVNNSWGDTGGNLWFSSAVHAWRAAGIFPVFSAGNTGACSSVGSPSDYQDSFSVGSYTSSGAISSFSSRGPGVFGDSPYIKPNLVAPGSNIISSIPGDMWGYNSGTSMAAPHVAGAVALLWSCAPQLVGNIDQTFLILQTSAAPAPQDNSCGAPSSASGNYTYGNGYLDVLAAGADVCQVGSIHGLVTDAASGQPLPGVNVTISTNGAIYDSVVSAADGTYSLAVTSGFYTLAAGRYGYYDQTSGSFAVLNGDHIGQDFALMPKAALQVSGQVTDGSGRGGPLAAKLTYQAGGADLNTTTDGQGYYSITLFTDTTYQVQVKSLYLDYLPVNDTFSAWETMLTRDYELQVNPETCQVPGYIRFGGVTQGFDQGSLPANWANIDYLGNGQGWTFARSQAPDTFTGSSGYYAVVDSAAYGVAGRQDTALVSPDMNFSRTAAVQLHFYTDYQYFGSLNDPSPEVADVDISMDGGGTWENLWRRTTHDYTGLVSLDLSSRVAGMSNVRLRFHYYNSHWDYWWKIDNVSVTPAATCVAVDNVYYFPVIGK